MYHPNKQQQQQQQQQQEGYFNHRHNGGRFLDNFAPRLPPPPLHLQHHQYYTPMHNINGAISHGQHTPMTPLDINYSQSMIPSNLLVSSPYFTPPPSATHFFSIPPPPPPQQQQQHQKNFKNVDPPLCLDHSLNHSHSRLTPHHGLGMEEIRVGCGIVKRIILTSICNILLSIP
ncbi:hypothetical protein LELG_01886 [Lodderomyces elongisporus NRRL YB-4239]|uniref:RNA-binding domain-containing protein n=1 Tax=Lodderomyces elongisporus (strain ATCC 11503 / CBS 2605 / JCM 1781 / NBRC 1676 / NRRL YB-4239) TaxID=379508 RepID=A5DWZ9_LODEL|nr:hypothetical protein LELG_01886 [Lodderomyces elongisporus NRRL YB-4239]